MLNEIKDLEETVSAGSEISEAIVELEKSVYSALETYANVHRGSGHNSIVTTHLYDKARHIVLESLSLKKAKYEVIFCTARRAEILKSQLDPKSYYILSSRDLGLSLGVWALVIEKQALPAGIPFQTGGGNARLVSPNKVIWAKGPERYEAGTPAIVNIIAFAKALLLTKKSGEYVFSDTSYEKSHPAKILHDDNLREYSGRKLLEKLRNNLIGRNVQVPTHEGSKAFINLDTGASTPTFEPIWEVVRKTWNQPKTIQEKFKQEVRSICSDFLGAPNDSYDVIFTSNTTEAINLAAENLALNTQEGIETVIVNTLLEHNSNELPWRMVPNASTIQLTVDHEGFVDLKELENILSGYNQEFKHGNKRIRLVAISGASNVLGTYNNLAEISRIAHHYETKLLVDAAQLVAHRKVEMKKWGIDYLAFSAHKTYAPFGSGVLMVRKGLLQFNPSELELIQNSGEENIVGIAALGKALVLLQRIGMDVIREEEQNLTAYALQGLATLPGLTTYGVQNSESTGFARKGGVIVFSLKGLIPNQLAKQLVWQGGIGVRYGCHCSHLLIKHLLKVSPGLERFQNLMLSALPKVNLPGVVRVSLGIENTEKEVDTLIQTLNSIALKSGIRNKQITDIKQEMNEFVILKAETVYSPT